MHYKKTNKMNDDQNDDDPYYDNYEENEDNGDKADNFYGGYDFSSVEVNSGLRTYQKENVNEEENLENSFQQKNISLTEVTKYKTKK